MKQNEDGDSSKAAAVGPAASGEKSGSAPVPTMSESDRRRARAAAKLKENLSRRKQQVRARRAGEADETVGLPAAKMDDL
ncbi:hypothetical protein [Rhizobium sp. HT1-10]|uniref:hypothetical protein n=1 Tax=Rhizobium sp. HT1-10 TaxID=3111638 RepID=UPI003C1E1DF9